MARPNKTQALYPIQLSPEDADLGKKYSISGPKDGPKYAAICDKERNLRVTGIHRVIAARILGRELIKGEVVDHANGDTLDNRRENLRVCRIAENSRNRRRSSYNTSGFKGVTWRKSRNKWLAAIKVDGKPIYLGLHDTPELAHAAYCAAARELHGEFARTE